MAEIKLTKNELRSQQNKLTQLLRYLPTLQLKKALLQVEVNEARLQTERLEDELTQAMRIAEEYAPLLAQKLTIDIRDFVQVKEIKKSYENIAGCDVPIFEGASFGELDYDLFDTPAWLDGAIIGLRKLTSARAEITVVEEKKKILAKELREVSIRVNLFEKILIPRALENIKTIKVFLGDQQLAAVSQAKVAKAKIELAKTKSQSLVGAAL